MSCLDTRFDSNSTFNTCCFPTDSCDKLYSFSTNLKNYNSLLKSICSFLKLSGDKSSLKPLKKVRKVIKSLISAQNMYTGSSKLADVNPSLDILEDANARKKFISTVADVTSIASDSIELSGKISKLVANENCFSKLTSICLKSVNPVVTLITLTSKISSLEISFKDLANAPYDDALLNIKRASLLKSQIEVTREVVKLSVALGLISCPTVSLALAGSGLVSGIMGLYTATNIKPKGDKKKDLAPQDFLPV